jgi:hypothetical protein
MTNLPSVEIFLARLYSDPAALDRFTADPAGEARRAGLAEPVVAELARADMMGLRMAADSYGWKRRQHRPASIRTRGG